MGGAKPESTLIVLDFDCTLAAMHMYALLRSGGQTALDRDNDAFYQKVFGGMQRVDELRAFLSGMRSSGATLFVLSNGFEAEIRPALQRLQLLDSFERQESRLHFAAILMSLSLPVPHDRHHILVMMPVPHLTPSYSRGHPLMQRSLPREMFPCLAEL